ncbi:hypothetical protein DPMN_184607 [Dreissena polymorpha]|uniref:Uncharacterized protein n=1 Tax=Dreissena polymorpha TaxID=45954 RepID=A0A9D4DJX3_DREPO|nr:hypothetical protein DPMN_184607 [Dreissena polymorpha]
MIRDKIVFTTSGKLQELLLREDELDLNKAVKLCRAYEQSLKHVQEMRDKNVNRVQQSTARPQKNTVRNKTSYQLKQQSQPCDYCGKLHAPEKRRMPCMGQEMFQMWAHESFPSKMQN